MRRELPTVWLSTCGPVRTAQFQTLRKTRDAKSSILSQVETLLEPKLIPLLQISGHNGQKIDLLNVRREVMM